MKSPIVLAAATTVCLSAACAVQPTSTPKHTTEAAVTVAAEAGQTVVGTTEAGATAAGASTQDAADAKTLTMSFDPTNTALVVTDPQNDFLSEEGVAWGVVGESVVENGTVSNIDALFRTAKQTGFPVFVSPHYYFPHDHKWNFEGTLEALMHDIHMFERSDQLSVEGFEGSGADWLAQYKKYIEDGETVVTSPHKVYGPETNDLVLQLRKRGIDRVILAGMSANLCTESHMRELIEQGFDVTVVSDGTAGGKTPDLGDGYAAAMVNFKFIANAVIDTEQAVASMRAASE